MGAALQTFLLVFSCCLVNFFNNVHGGNKGSNIVVHGSDKQHGGSVIVNSDKKGGNIVIRDHRGTVVLNNSGKKGANIVINNIEEHKKSHHAEVHHPKMMPMNDNSRADSKISKYKSKPLGVKPYGSSEDAEEEDVQPQKRRKNTESSDEKEEAYSSKYGKEGEDGYEDGVGPLSQADRKGIRDLEQGVEFGVEAQVEDAVEKQIEQGFIRPVQSDHDEISGEYGGLLTGNGETFESIPLDNLQKYHADEPYIGQPGLNSDDALYSVQTRLLDKDLEESSWTIPVSTLK